MKNVSKIILGSDQFGTAIDWDTAFSLLDYYYQAGGRTLDTARAYGGRHGHLGVSEQIIGSWIKTRKVESEVTVITKGGHPPYENLTESRITKECLRKDIDASFEALGLSNLPIYFLHRDHPSLDIAVVVETMSELLSEYSIDNYGLSNWHHHRIAAAIESANNLGVKAPIASEIQWSILRSTPKKYGDESLVLMDCGEIEWYQQTKFPVFVYGSQARGFVTKTINNGLEENGVKAMARYHTKSNLAIVDKIKKVSRISGLTPTQITLAYVGKGALEKAVPIIGPSCIDQLKDSLSYLEISEEESIAQILDCLFSSIMAGSDSLKEQKLCSR